VFSWKKLAWHGRSPEQSSFLYQEMEGALRGCSFKYAGSQLAARGQDEE
jgi:hypothetical protein